MGIVRSPVARTCIGEQTIVEQMNYEHQITRAKSIVDDARVEPELRSTAFGHVLAHLLRQEESPAVAAEDTKPKGRKKPAGVSAPPDPGAGDEESAESKVSSALGVGTDDLSAFFILEDGEPALRVHLSKLPDGNPEMTREIAIMICAAREALGLGTDSRHILVAVKDYGRQNCHFSEWLDAVPTTEVSVQKKKNARVYPLVLRMPGREAAKEIGSRWASQ